MTIFQYLPHSAAKKVLRLSSTFKLSSLRYYSELEDDGSGVADPLENKPSFKGGSAELSTNVMISSWCISEKKCQAPDWNIFKDRRDGIAIQSTFEKVQAYIDLHTKYSLSDHWLRINDKVTYYSPNEGKPQGFIVANAPFYKSDKYVNQSEFRFTIYLTHFGDYLESFTFYNMRQNECPDYIEKIFIGPEASGTQISEYIEGAAALDSIYLVDELKKYIN